MLIARLHATSMDWFTPSHRSKLFDVMPVLAEEPDNSWLYTCAAQNLSSGAKCKADQNQVRALMAILPRPQGHGAQLVNVHGDICHTNVLRSAGRLML